MNFSAQPVGTGATDSLAPGSKDGRGCADNDRPYTFDRRPRAAAPFPFTPRQFGRLLALRGRIRDGIAASDEHAAVGEGLPYWTGEAEPDHVAQAILHAAGVLEVKN
jgi:hypothetical protein